MTISRVCLLLALAWSHSPSVASACDTFDGRADAFQLKTRKPVVGEEVRLVSGFGMRRHPILQITKLHTGVDWVAEIGTPVIAARGGLVSAAKMMGEYGNAIIIDHGAGWQTVYAHLSRIEVREGDCVAAGALIGALGATGMVGGPRLHFEVRLNDQPLDPLKVPVN